MTVRTVSCGICGDSAARKPLRCATCASLHSLGEQISLMNVQNKVAGLRADVNHTMGTDLKYPMHPNVASDSVGSDKDTDPASSHHHWTHLLTTRAGELRAQLSLVREAVAASRKTTDAHRRAAETARKANNEIRAQLAARREDMLAKTDRCTKELQHEMRQQHQKCTTLQTRIASHEDDSCAKLTSLFLIRRARRRRDRLARVGKAPHAAHAEPDGEGDSYDVLMGLNVVPDLALLPLYSHASVNCAVERVGYFCVLMAYYLNITLPFEVKVPQKGVPVLAVSRHGAMSTKMATLVIDNKIHEFAKTNPAAFDRYTELLAMLALCVAHIATCIGISVTTPAQVAAINDVIAAICAKCAAPPVVRYPPPASSAVPDLASVKFFIATQTYLEIDGDSAEWNLIEKEADDEA